MDGQQRSDDHTYVPKYGLRVKKTKQLTQFMLIFHSIYCTSGPSPNLEAVIKRGGGGGGGGVKKISHVVHAMTSQKIKNKIHLK